MSLFHASLSNCLHIYHNKEYKNYPKLPLSINNQFNFLVQIDMKKSNSRQSLIAHEIHQLEDEAPIKEAKEEGQENEQ